MNLECMTKEELELLTYPDIAYMLINENKKPMNTPELFKKICELLSYTEEQYAEKIGDFYTSLTTDKRFILLETAEWDLRSNHAVKIVVEDDEEEIDEEIDEDEEEIDEEMIDDVIEDDELDLNLDDEDIDDDTLDDLPILDDEDIEE